MFWLARLIRLPRPMPPTPTPATFSVSLGGVKPRPSTWRGPIATPAVPAATFFKNLRLDSPSSFCGMCSPRAPNIIAHVRMARHDVPHGRRDQPPTVSCVFLDRRPYVHAAARRAVDEDAG